MTDLVSRYGDPAERRAAAAYEHFALDDPQNYSLFVGMLRQRSGFTNGLWEAFLRAGCDVIRRSGAHDDPEDS